MHRHALSHLSDEVLVRDLSDLVARERATTAEVLAHIAEVDSRRLYLPAGRSSMHTYCVEVLRLSDDAAYKRIQAARAGRQFPVLFDALADGRLHLTGACLLAPHLTDRNVEELLKMATYRRKSEIEVQLARMFPETRASEPTATVRVLPAIRSSLAPGQVDLGLGTLPQGAPQAGSGHGATPVAGSRQAGSGQAGSGQADPANAGSEGAGSARAGSGRPIELGNPGDRSPMGSRESERPDGSSDDGAPGSDGGGSELAPGQVEAPSSAPSPVERYLVRVTIGRDLHDKLRYAQALLSHAVPSGDIAEVLDRALDTLIAQLEKRKIGSRTRSRTFRRIVEGSRYIPASVRQAVWDRDDSRCTFVGANGHRCEARRFLQFDHVRPFARGGKPTVEGLRLRCWAHNQHLAERAFGSEFMSRKRAESRQARAPKKLAVSEVAGSPAAEHEAPSVAAASEPAVSEAAMSEAAMSETAVSEAAVSEDAVSEAAVSEDAVSEDAVSEDAVSEDAMKAAVSGAAVSGAAANETAASRTAAHCQGTGDREAPLRGLHEDPDPELNAPD